MHFIKSITCLVLCIGAAVAGKSQLSAADSVRVNRFEYYFDTDPGVGNGSQVIVNPSVQAVSGFNFSAPIGALSKGLHTLNVRALDSVNRTSLTARQLFYKENVVMNPTRLVDSSEYFFDNDPGFGNGIPGSYSDIEYLGFNVSGVLPPAPGFHRFFVRVRDVEGNWSLTTNALFYSEPAVSNPIPNISSAEYYFDSDPGVGNGTPAALTAAQQVVIAFSGDISSLSNGLHRLFIRVRDANGKYSLTTNQLFYKEAIVNNPTANVVAAEYYFDTDPGFGNGTAATVTAGQQVVINFSGDISALQTGLHRLFVRTRDANGKYSLTTNQLFYKEAVAVNLIPNVVAAEYFFDTDPGFGNATAAAVTAGQNVVIPFNADISALTNGLHRMFIRVRDANGKYSLTTAQLMYKEPAISNPIPNIVAAEYFIDTDPGFGNGTGIAVTPAQTVSPLFGVASGSLTKGWHRLFVRVRDANGKWALTTTQFFYYEQIVTPHPLGKIVKFEWFWNTDPGFGNANTVTAPANNNGQVTNLAFDAPVQSTWSGTKQNFFIRSLDDEFSLTTLRVIDFSGIVLPVTALEFSAKAQLNTVMTNWTTNAEINLEKFDVEHSADGVNFTRFATVQAHGSAHATTDYSAEHLTPVAGMNYYRLKHIDNGGVFKHSPVIKIIFNGGKAIPVAYPNPVSDRLNVMIPSGLMNGKKFSLVLSDARGSVLHQQQTSVVSNQIDVSRMAAGNYVVVLRDESGDVVWKTTILKR